ncbi:hypothetical protein [Flavobacterium sp.]|uniref:hypothetical protein n=1 Tax=Flavobacterium sp. TaxID=239 RepID=UPI0037505157
MKKIIFVLTLMLAFSINANAQDKKMNYQEVSKKESAELSELLGLNDTQTADFYRLFEMKNQTLQGQELSPERSIELSRIIDMKIKATLTEEQIKKLEANTELYERLIAKPKMK